MGTLHTTVVIIGAGQAGLAMSRVLSAESIDHVLLERGKVGESWRSERWDSLRLLTPNWMTRLPGHEYEGSDPHGFMVAACVVDLLANYATVGAAPVWEFTTVESVEPVDDGFVVTSDAGVLRCRCVVDASGAARVPNVPSLGAHLPSRVEQITPQRYRNPSQLNADRVLVVGASASGAQIADELASAGAAVTLSVGDHVRVPRSYRGRDIQSWLDAVGILDERLEAVADPERARRLPSLQLVGSLERRNLGLNELADAGVELVGRLVGATDTNLQFSGAFNNACVSADLKLNRLLQRIDDWVDQTGVDAGDVDRPAPTNVPTPRLLAPVLDFDAVVWATGYRLHHPWLPAEVHDSRGALVHDGGILPIPGLYALGLPFMRRRKSAFLDGVADDARELGKHMVSHLNRAVGRSREGLLETVCS